MCRARVSFFERSAMPESLPRSLALALTLVSGTLAISCGGSAQAADQPSAVGASCSTEADPGILAAARDSGSGAMALPAGANERPRIYDMILERRGHATSRKSGPRVEGERCPKN